jgi:tetratricopeptide (TPR) repeat protein
VSRLPSLSASYSVSPQWPWRGGRRVIPPRPAGGRGGPVTATFGGDGANYTSLPGGGKNLFYIKVDAYLKHNNADTDFVRGTGIERITVEFSATAAGRCGRGEAQAQYGLGKVCLCQRRFEEASQVFATAFPLVRRLHDLLGETYLLRGLSEAQFELGLVSEAEHNLTTALKIGRALDESFAEASASLALGILYGSQSDSSRAEDHINRALTLFSEMNNIPWRARALCALAKSRNDQGDHVRAREIWSEAYTLLSALRSPEAEEIAVLLSQTSEVTSDEV